MKMFSYLRITAAFIFLSYFLSCSKQDVSQPTIKNPLTVKAMKDSVAKIVAGMYTGKTPCADCKVINYTLMLSSSMNFSSISEYVGKNVVPIKTSGTWRMVGDSIIATQDTSAQSFFQIANNDTLYMLDASMKRLTGPTPSMFILRKGEMAEDTTDTSGISGKKFVLEIINDKKVSEKDYMNGLPNLNFDTGNRAVHGSSGCNRLSGQVDVKGSGISFLNLALTRMMCPGDGETKFLAALKGTKTFKVENDKLYLMDGAKTLAVFQSKADSLKK